MFSIQLVDVEDVTVSPDAWWLISFTVVHDVDGTDVIDARSCCGHSCCRGRLLLLHVVDVRC